MSNNNTDTLLELNNDILSQIFGYAGGILVVCLNIPLIIKVVKEKSSKSLSTTYLILNQLTAFIYITYGILINQWPIIGNNIAFSIIVFILIGLKIHYDKKNKNNKNNNNNKNNINNNNE